MKCPYCAHENPSDAERCASCLQKLDAAPDAPTAPVAPAASAVRAAKLVCARCGTTNPFDARICSCCQGSLDPSAEPSLSPSGESVPQAAAPRIAGKVVGCLVSLGVLAAAIFAGRELLSTGPRHEDRKPAVADSSTPGKAERAPLVPKAVPQTGRVPATDPRAEEQYRLALAWLKRGDPAQARRLLQEVIRKFPHSPYAGRAQAQLERLPPASESAAARREQAIAEFRDRYRDESSKGKRHSTITEDDIGGISKAPSDMKASKVLIPPAAESTAPPQAPANQLTLVSANVDGTQLTLRVAYQLGASHQRPVHAAARLTYPAGNSLFAYGAEALGAGSGETIISLRLTMPITTTRPASIRLMLFESQGPMFFSVTVPYP